MATYFVDPSGGNDTNDGQDPLGLGVATGSWTAATNVLVKTGAFAAVSVGDYIYLSSATAAQAALYKVTVKTDNNTITCGTVIDGTDISTDQTDIASSDGPWASTNKAIDTAGSQAVVRLMATATETLTTSITGTVNSQTYFIGSDAVGDFLATGSYYTIDGNAAATNCLNVSAGLEYDFSHVRFTNAAADNIDLNGSSSIVILSFCRVDNAVSDGIFGDNVNSSAIITGTEIDNNGGWGVRQSTSSRVKVFAVGCSIHDNGSGGVFVGSEAHFSHCLIYANTGDGISTKCNTLSNCVLYNNSGDGVDVSGITQMVNNVFASNGGYGWRKGSEVDAGDRMFSNNLWHNNTSGHVDSTDTSNVPGINNVVDTDPSFANVTGGSEDFTPSAGSPLIRAGLLASNIGAIASVVAGGSGGGSVINTRRTVVEALLSLRRSRRPATILAPPAPITNLIARSQRRIIYTPPAKERRHVATVLAPPAPINAFVFTRRRKLSLRSAGPRIRRLYHTGGTGGGATTLIQQSKRKLYYVKQQRRANRAHRGVLTPLVAGDVFIVRRSKRRVM